MGRQHQGMDRPGVRQVPEGSGEQGKIEKTGCKIICGAPTILAVKELMMMMMMIMMMMTAKAVRRKRSIRKKLKNLVRSGSWSFAERPRYRNSENDVSVSN